jgi:uncharacterized protein YecE (DUF72 family)
MSMRVHSGTSGFSFPAWKGVFYPEKTPAKGFLSYYASHLGTVELNNTFYRMPQVKDLEGWCAQVPPEFRFAVKAPRRITHLSRLKDCQEPLDALVERLGALGQRLGCVLFQLPPNMKLDHARLEKFLSELGGRVPTAFEFRHPSWYEASTLDLLREHQVAMCVGDPEDDGNYQAPWISTANFAYVRLRADSYTDAQLREWAVRISRLPAQEAFVFFKHEVTAPEYAQRLLVHAREIDS